METKDFSHVADPVQDTVKRTDDNASARGRGRKANAAYRSREHLDRAEVDRLVTAARGNRYGHRDATMILIAYRHGLRAIEVVNLRWEQFSLDAGRMHVTRVKNGNAATHPLDGEEIRALRRLKREQEPASPFVFTTERGGPFTTAGFRRMFERAAKSAGLEVKAHAHMLRHGAGFFLANRGTDTRTIQDYLGHRNIQNTVRYTRLSPERFKNLWD